MAVIQDTMVAMVAVAAIYLHVLYSVEVLCSDDHNRGLVVWQLCKIQWWL